VRTKTIDIQLPPTWAEVEVQWESLEADPGEDRDLFRCPTVLELPRMITFDFADAAYNLNWTLGQLVSYLAVQGIMSLIREQEGVRA